MIKEPHLNDLEKRAFDLCSAVYRLLRLFPENEALGRQIKETANIVTAEILSVERIGRKMPLTVPAAFVQETFSEMLLSAIRNIEKLIGLLWIAKSQDWLHPTNFDVLITSYAKIQEMLASREIASPVAVSEAKSLEKVVVKPPPVESFVQEEPLRERPLVRPSKPAASVRKELNPRQKKLLEIIRKQGEAKMGDFLEFFKDTVTERTLRNDLRDLAEQGLIRAEGEYKTRKYYIK